MQHCLGMGMTCPHPPRAPRAGGGGRVGLGHIHNHMTTNLVVEPASRPLPIAQLAD